MNDRLEELTKYLTNIGDKNFGLEIFNRNSSMPLLFKNNYDFYHIKLFNHSYALALSKENTLNIQQLIKLNELLNLSYSLDLLFFSLELTSKNRTRLREKGLSYIAGNNNYFLTAGMLNENNKNINKKNKKLNMSYLAQKVYLYFLYEVKVKVTLKNISNYFDISEMHASRALSELYDFKLIDYEVHGKTGRAKIYSKNSKINFFQNGYKLAQTPVKSTIYTDNIPFNAIISGETVLAKLTNLTYPSQDVYAIDKKEIKRINKVEDGEFQVELWEYSPKLFEKEGMIDVFSLACIFKEEKDARVINELEILLGEQKWYQE